MICMFALTFSLRSYSADNSAAHIEGHYPDKRLEEVHTLILPRIFLYDAKNHLVPTSQWPAELASFSKHKFDDEHCCLAYYKVPGGGRPPECATWMNYDSEGANWVGLIDASGKKIDPKAFPHHKWLIVEYGAAWCGPCVAEEKQLRAMFSSIANASDYAWLTIDMTRVPDVKKANET
jgi:hypothetical protein